MNGRGSPSGSRARAPRGRGGRSRSGASASSRAGARGDLAPRAHVERARRRHAPVDEGGERDRAGLPAHARAERGWRSPTSSSSARPLHGRRPAVPCLRLQARARRARDRQDATASQLPRAPRPRLARPARGARPAPPRQRRRREAGRDGRAGATRGGAFTAAITGDHSVGNDFNTLSQRDLENGELAFGLPAALVVLVLVFGAVVAGLVPVLMAILSILVGLGIVALLSLEFTSPSSS